VHVISIFAALNVVALDFVRRNLLKTTAWFLLPVQRTTVQLEKLH